jgi:diguanylate cyclase (GGDEF)-like protein
MSKTIQELQEMELALQRANRALQLIIKCHDAIMKARTEEQLLERICHILVDNIQYKLAWVGIARKDAGKTVIPIAHVGFEEGYLDSLIIHWGKDAYSKGPTGQAFRTGKTQVNQDIQNNPDFEPWRERALQYGYQSSIALPCTLGKHVLFVLNIYAAEIHAFNRQEIEALEMLAKDIAFGVGHLRTKDERNTDKLTGLANRRYFDEVLDVEWRRARRNATPITLVMIDIDFFKLYNDFYGHLAGDECLQIIAKTIYDVVSRPADFVARYGGEEFVIILPNSDSSAIAVAEKCRMEVEKLAIPHELSPQETTLTVSIGMSTQIPHKRTTTKDIIIAADKALYTAKEEGRNRTVQG